MLEGTKFSVNVWAHDDPFQLAHNIGCDAGPLESSDELHTERDEARRRDVADDQAPADGEPSDEVEEKDDL